jgi:hypothetical protein
MVKSLAYRLRLAFELATTDVVHCLPWAWARCWLTAGCWPAASSRSGFKQIYDRQLFRLRNGFVKFNGKVIFLTFDVR